MRKIFALTTVSLFGPIILTMQPFVVGAQDVSHTNPESQEHQDTADFKLKTNERNIAKQENKSALDFSETGRPGQQTAGESRGSCANSQKIQALIPASHSGKTVHKHPKFWVYFPEISSEFSHVEFSVQNQSREDIWRTQLDLTSQPGYKQFSLPDHLAPLEVGEWYRWYVKVYCKSEVASAQHVQGWVSRVPLSSKLYLDLQDQKAEAHHIYGNHQIWYDSVDNLLLKYQQNPDKLNLEKDWQDLLSAKGVNLDKLPSIGGSRLSQY